MKPEFQRLKTCEMNGSVFESDSKYFGRQIIFVKNVMNFVVHELNLQ
jgi:hypothetical protein